MDKGSKLYAKIFGKKMKNVLTKRIRRGILNKLLVSS